MLTAYLTATRNLLQLPGTASTSLYTDANLTTFINTSRGQLAGEAECIRVLGTVPTVVGQQPYLFSAINTGVTATNGVQGAIHVRSVRWSVGDGSVWVTPRPWEWFELFQLGSVTNTPGPPVEWSQFGQGAVSGSTGSGASGSFYIGPSPDAIYTLNCDCVCYPQPLALDTDVEAIPYLWTDAVPYLAAYYALLSAETNARMQDAMNYYKIYSEFVTRARTAANPSVNRWQYEKAADPAQAAKFNVKGAGG